MSTPPILRSALYVPASNQKVLEKSASLEVDALIYDLEDAVLPDQKELARQALAAALNRPAKAGLRTVRINTLSSQWGAEDVKHLQTMPIDALVLPKTETLEDVTDLASLAPKTPIWAMIETALGVCNVNEIAAHPNVHCIMLGTNDLAKTLSLSADPERLGLLYSLSKCVLAARSYGCRVLDGVYNRFTDGEGLETEAIQGRRLGFHGKTILHPSQIDITHRVFGPSAEEIAHARAVIIAFEEAKTTGQGVAVLDGAIIEALHVEDAQRILAVAESVDVNRA